MTKSASESSQGELDPVRGSGKRENASSSPYAPENPIPDFSPAPNLTEQRPFPVPELSEQGNCSANAWQKQELTSSRKKKMNETLKSKP